METPDFHAYLTRLPYELAFSEDDPASIIDRYYTPTFQYRNDGITLDRQRLIDHTTPARKTTKHLDIQIHETLTDGPRAAARFTMTAHTRKDKVIKVEVHLFAEYAPDGRIAQANALTRTLDPST
ncbi:nuclear transport factor 2 family protein [Nonomuraea sp. NPDC050328]|uniref:nuclear transport factor 2 family protein n=1 Tax=Nonomuraea sp. NPDC050328 TaxID=3364361 RepID=UPI00378ACCFC